MNLTDLAPYLTGPALGAFAVGLAHFLRALAKRALAKAKATADKSDDVVAERWNARAMWLETIVIFTVRYFVPAALAPSRDVDGEES